MWSTVLVANDDANVAAAAAEPRLCLCFATMCTAAPPRVPPTRIQSHALSSLCGNELAELINVIDLFIFVIIDDHEANLVFQMEPKHSINAEMQT